MSGCSGESSEQTPPGQPTVPGETPSTGALCGPVEGELQEAGPMPPGARYLALDSHQLYAGGEAAGETGALWRRSRDGGSPWVDLGVGGSLTWFTYSEGQLWCQSDDNSAFFSLLSGSSQPQVRTDVKAPSYAFPLAVNTKAIAWYDHTTDRLLAQLSDGSLSFTEPTELAHDVPAHEMLVTGTYVYLASADRVQRVPLAGGPVEQVHDQGAYGMVTDGLWIYWAFDGKLRRLARSGGSPETIAMMPQVGGELMGPPAGGCLYVRSYDGIRRLPREGGALSMVVPAGALDLNSALVAVDDRAIYLTEIDSGQLRTMPLR